MGAVTGGFDDFGMPGDRENELRRIVDGTVDGQARVRPERFEEPGVCDIADDGDALRRRVFDHAGICDGVEAGVEDQAGIDAVTDDLCLVIQHKIRADRAGSFDGIAHIGERGCEQEREEGKRDGSPSMTLCELSLNWTTPSPVRRVLLAMTKSVA